MKRGLVALGQMSQTKGRWRKELWEIQARWENGDMGEGDRWENKKGVSGKGTPRTMGQDIGVLRDSGRMVGADEKGVVRIQWDKGEM